MQSKNYFSSDCDIGHERRVSDLSPSPKYLVFTLASQTWSTKKIWTKKCSDSADQAPVLLCTSKYFLLQTILSISSWCWWESFILILSCLSRLWCQPRSSLSVNLMKYFPDSILVKFFAVSPPPPWSPPPWSHPRVHRSESRNKPHQAVMLTQNLVFRKV